MKVVNIEAVIEETPPIEGWRCFKDTGDRIVALDYGLDEFVINEYNQAEKTIHVDYGNLIVMTVKLKNGFVIVEHCICMDPKEFDIDKGIQICTEKVLNKLFEIYQPVSIKNPENIKKFTMKAK